MAYIPVVLGTARESRRSEMPARHISAALSERAVETELIDVREHLWGPYTIHSKTPHPQAQKWRDRATRADGFILIVPEYNHGYPGELKMFLDCAFSEYKHKPVLCAGVSKGRFGGTRGVHALLPSLAEMGMIPHMPPLYFSHVGDSFAEDGTCTDESTVQAVEKKLTEFISRVENMS